MWNPQANEDENDNPPVVTTNVLTYDGTILTSNVDSITSSQNVSGTTINVNDPTNNNASAKLNTTLANIFNAIPQPFISLTTYGAVYASASNAISSTAAMAAGKFLMGTTTTTAPILVSIAGQNINQITVVPQPLSNILRLSLPQDIGITSNVQFGQLIVNKCSIIGTPINPTDGTNKAYVDSVVGGSYTAGTGLTLSGNQFSITNTGIVADTYGSQSAVPVITVNAQGQIIGVITSRINISATQITSDILPATFGGTGNAYTQFNGPSSTTKTFTLPNATCNIATDYNITITPGPYGSSYYIPRVTINSLGQVTAVEEMLPYISGEQITSGTIDALQGGTSSNYTQFTGANTTVKAYNLPNANCNILTDFAKVTIAQGGTNSNTTLTNNKIMISSAGAIVESSIGFSSGQVTLSSTANNQINLTYTSGGGPFSGGSVQLVQDNTNAVAFGERLGVLGFAGASNNTHTIYQGASIAAYATQAYTGSAGGTGLIISTTPNNSLTQQSALGLDENQQLTLFGYSGAAGEFLTVDSVGLVSTTPIPPTPIFIENATWTPTFNSFGGDTIDSSWVTAKLSVAGTVLTGYVTIQVPSGKTISASTSSSYIGGLPYLTYAGGSIQKVAFGTITTDTGTVSGGSIYMSDTGNITASTLIIGFSYTINS